MSRIKNVLEYLEESAEKFPQKIAFADEEKSITYAQLQKNAKRMACGILKKTLPRTPVAVLGEKSVEEVCMTHGIPAPLFLMVCNVYTFGDYLPGEGDLKAIDVRSLLGYLQSSHHYYKFSSCHFKHL